MSPRRRGGYDVFRDKFVEEVAAVTEPPYTPWPDVRYQALQAALQAAKLGLSHDIYQTAVRYAAWLSGGEPEAVPQLPFQTRLQALVDECKRSGEVDDDYVIHIMQVVMGIPPDPLPGTGPDAGHRGEQP